MTINWERHLVPPQSGAAWKVPAGALIRLIDIEGSQTGDLFLVDATDLNDGLSNGRSFDYNGSVALTVGAKLYSKKSRVLATITADDVGRHDFLYAPCSQEMYEIQNEATPSQPHPNCYDNLTGALARFGVPASTVTIAFNFFMCSAVGADGRLKITPPTSRAGDAVTFEAARDIVIAVSACSATTANGGASPRPLAVEIGRR